MKKLFLGFDARRKKILLDPEQRTGHMHVIGSTRSGKSKFLEWMIRQDIRNQQGFCLLDPHGSLYEDIVSYLSYLNLDKDVILLNLSVGDHIIGFNPFERTGEEVSVKVDYQISSTIRAWGQEHTDETPRLEKWLRCIYQALSEKGETILASEYLINYYEREEREFLISDLEKKIIKDQWREIASQPLGKFYEQLESTKNRLMRFLCSDQICRFMGLSDPRINIRNIMEEGKILLVNLASSGSLSDANARLFGALLVNEFFTQAKRRKRDERGRKPKPYYLYIDEFQDFVSPDIAKILDQAAKFGLYLILSHQRWGHLKSDEDLMDAILTNVKTRAVFGGLSKREAKRTAEEMFIGQLDLKEIKKAIYQTKFWPVYSRDTVYSKGTGTASISSRTSGLSAGSSSQLSPGEGWFDIPAEIGSTESQVEISSDTESEAYSEFESETDVPIFIPVPFEELSSVQYWSLEEQIWKMTGALKRQFPRHCFIQIFGKKTQPILVPFVKEYRVPSETKACFEKKVYQKTKAIPKERVDELIGSRKKRLELEARKEIEPKTFRVPKKTIKEK